MWNEQWKEENEIFHERHDLTIERIRMIGTEQTAAEQFRPYFRHVAEFLLFVEEVRAMVEDGSWEKLSFDEMKEINHKPVCRHFRRKLRNIVCKSSLGSRKARRRLWNFFKFSVY